MSYSGGLKPNMRDKEKIIPWGGVWVGDSRKVKDKSCGRNCSCDMCRILTHRERNTLTLINMMSSQVQTLEWKSLFLFIYFLFFFFKFVCSPGKLKQNQKKQTKMIKTTKKKILNSRFTINEGRKEGGVGGNELRVLSERRWSSATGLELKDPQRWAERVAVVKAVHPDACTKKKPCCAVFLVRQLARVLCALSCRCLGRGFRSAWGRKKVLLLNT